MVNLHIVLQRCNGSKSVVFSRTSGMIATAIGTSILNAGFGLFAISANLLSMIVIYRKGSTRIPADLFIASLSLTDFLVGLLVQPFYIILRLHELADVHLCVLRKVYAFIGYLCCGLSMLTISCFSLDRVIAIAYPYVYNAEASNTKSTTVIIVCWLFWFIYTLLPFCGVISSKSYYLSLSCVIPLSVSISVICYIYVMAVVRRHMRKSTPQVPTSSAEGESNRSKRNTLWLKAQWKKSITIVVIVLVFVLCFIPKVCSMVGAIILGNSLDALNISSKWSDTLVFINSSLNPIIYVLRIEEMRQDMFKIIRSLKNKVCCNSD